MKSLEKRIDMPDWRQWLPFWGVRQISADSSDNKPTIIDEKYGNTMLVAAIAVHTLYAMAATFGVLYGLYNIIHSTAKHG